MIKLILPQRALGCWPGLGVLNQVDGPKHSEISPTLMLQNPGLCITHRVSWHWCYKPRVVHYSQSIMTLMLQTQGSPLITGYHDTDVTNPGLSINHRVSPYWCYKPRVVHYSQGITTLMLQTQGCPLLIGVPPYWYMNVTKFGSHLEYITNFFVVHFCVIFNYNLVASHQTLIQN